ncbi:hypothetical protein V8E51_007855 [Hyaloscypha variabilis]
MCSQSRSGEDGGVKFASDYSHPTANLRGGSNNRKKWWRNAFMSGGESDVSDDSSDFERSPFRHLRRYLRCPLGTDSNETRDLSDVSLPRIEPPDLRSSRDSPSVEQHEQPTDARIPSEVKRVASIGFRNGSPNDAAMGQKILSNKRRATRAQVPSKQMYSSRTFRVPYIFEFVPFPGHTCKGRGTTQLETVVINVDSNSQLNRSFSELSELEKGDWTSCQTLAKDQESQSSHLINCDSVHQKQSRSALTSFPQEELLLFWTPLVHDSWKGSVELEEDSIRRFGASTRKKVRDIFDSDPDAAAPAPPPATALNEPGPGGLSSSDTLKGDVDPKDSLEIQPTSSPKNLFPSHDTPGELNNDTCPPTKGAPEPTHHRHLAPASSRSSANYQNRDLDGQKDDEARKNTASKKASHAASTNENEMPPPAFDSKKGKEAHKQSPPNQDPVQIEAKNKRTIQKAASDGQKIKGMVLPTLPVSSSTSVLQEPNPLKLPTPPPSTARNLPASSVSSFTDNPAQPAAGSVDAPPVPAIGVIPPTPPAANNSARQGDVLWNPTTSSASSRASSSDKQREKGTQQSKTHAQAGGPTIPEFPPASTRTSAHRRASSSSGGASKNVSFAEESSLLEEIPNYYQSSASDRPPSRSGSNAGSLRGIIKQQPKHMQSLAVADTPVVYLVISERATTEDCGPWEQVVHRTEGVYFGKEDANNKVVSMYNERWGDVAKYATLSAPTRQDSPFYRWETPKMVQGRYIRVLVEQHSVKAVSNEPKVWPKRPENRRLDCPTKR